MVTTIAPLRVFETIRMLETLLISISPYRFHFLIMGL
jgi:hypothetical protein